jgi:hypothetical protein
VALSVGIVGEQHGPGPGWRTWPSLASISSSPLSVKKFRRGGL